MFFLVETGADCTVSRTLHSLLAAETAQGRLEAHEGMRKTNCITALLSLAMRACEISILLPP